MSYNIIKSADAAIKGITLI